MFAQATADVSRKSPHPEPPAPRPSARGPAPGRNLGNQATLRRLAIGAANDPLEHEADRVADQVMRMAGPPPRLSAAPAQLSRKCAGCEEEKTGALQMKPASAARTEGAAPAIVHDVIGAPGQALDTGARSFLEPRFGRDFSGVRVHADAAAQQSCRAVGARAYTVGEHLVFGQGQYQPATPSGQRLLSHELAHVIQQGSAGPMVQRDGDDKPPKDAPHDAPQGTPNAGPAKPPGSGPGKPESETSERKCGPDITTSMNTMLAKVGPWYSGLTGWQQTRSCKALGPAAPLFGVNPIMAWDTRELFLPNTGWLDAYRRRKGCGSPQIVDECDKDDTRAACEQPGTCGNTVVYGGKCMLAGTANYALFGAMCKACDWSKTYMNGLIKTYKAVSSDSSGPPVAMAGAAYDGIPPTVPAAAENRSSCVGRCGLTHGGAFDFIWEPYRPR